MSSSVSSATINGSSAKVARNAKRDLNPNSSRSRIFGSSALSNSSRKVAGSTQGGPTNQASRVYLDGVDVTPQSLLVSRIKPTFDTRVKGKPGSGKGRGKQSNSGSTSLSSASISNINESLSSIDTDLSDGSDSAPTSRNQPPALSINKAAPTKLPAMESEDENGEGHDVENVDGLKIERPRGSGRLTDEYKSPLETSEFSKYLWKHLRRPISVQFSETSTIMLFELKSVCVGQDSIEHQQVSARNKQYLDMCAGKKGSDKYVEGRSQTLQLSQKTKEVMTAPPATRDAACIATDWDIFDCNKIEEDHSNEHDDNGLDNNHKVKSLNDGEVAGGNHLKKQVDEIVDATLVSPGCVLDVDGDIVEDLRARQYARARKVKSHGAGGHTSSKNRSGQTSNRSTHDVGRSSANVLVSGASMNSPSQSSGNVSYSASTQDVLNGGDDSGSNPSSQVGISVSRLNNGESGSNAGGQNAYSRANTNVNIGEIIMQRKTKKVLSSSSLLKTLSVVERAVQQNVFHYQHLLYRNFPSVAPGYVTLPKKSSEEKSEWKNPAPSFPSLVNNNQITSKGVLEKLWGYKCSITNGRTVTSLAWNTANEDLLAVSYSADEEKRKQAGASPHLSSAGDGLVLFWSLKNPEYPQRIYHLEAAVTSIDFSRSHPYLLALGFSNGVVAIYDTRKTDHASQESSVGGDISTSNKNQINNKTHVPIPIATNEVSSGKHLDAVWQVKWVSKGSERGENVVSISSDGRVTEWSMKKGLSFSDLMTLKRIPNPLLGSESRTDGVISRQASGHCIDFVKNDPSVYFVGTEDGMIHKCSVSYNEQYLETYVGHTGPVYEILVSPFCSDIFLSCSGDWNMKLWFQGQQAEKLNFRSVDLASAVNGVSWCPSDSTIFASVTDDGRIEIWDLMHSTLDPVISHFPTKSASQVPSTSGEGDPVELSHANLVNEAFACTKVTFAPTAPVIVVGDSTGEVSVYRVPTLIDGRCDGFSLEELVLRLQNAINPNSNE